MDKDKKVAFSKLELVISFIAVIGVAATILGLGYNIGRDKSSEKYELLSINYQNQVKKNSKLLEDNKLLQGELNDLKVSLIKQDQVKEVKPIDISNKNENTNNKTGYVYVNINEGESFIDKATGISISLISVNYEGSPARYKAIFRVEGTSKETDTSTEKEAVEEAVDIGYKVVVLNHEIMLKDITYTSAAFSIKSLN